MNAISYYHLIGKGFANSEIKCLAIPAPKHLNFTILQGEYQSCLFCKIG